MPWWVEAYFVLTMTLTVVNVMALLYEKASLARIALWLGGATSLLLSAWAYWQPGVEHVLSFDLRRMFGVAVVCMVVDCVWSLREERRAHATLDRREFIRYAVISAALVWLWMSPALWWGYQAAFGAREEGIGTCPIIERHEDAPQQDAVETGNAEPQRAEGSGRDGPPDRPAVE